MGGFFSSRKTPSSDSPSSTGPGLASSAITATSSATTVKSATFPSKSAQEQIQALCHDVRIWNHRTGEESTISNCAASSVSVEVDSAHRIVTLRLRFCLGIFAADKWPTHLRSLDLSGHYLNTLDAGALRHLPATLESLLLTSVQEHPAPCSFCLEHLSHLHNLRVLHVGGNAYSGRLPFESWPLLEHLILGRGSAGAARHSRLTEAPDLTRLPFNLKSLVLPDKTLPALPPGRTDIVLNLCHLPAGLTQFEIVETELRVRYLVDLARLCELRNSPYWKRLELDLASKKILLAEFE